MVKECCSLGSDIPVLSSDHAKACGHLWEVAESMLDREALAWRNESCSSECVHDTISPRSL